MFVSKPSIKVIIFIIIISSAAGGIAFYIAQPKKTISPISSQSQKNSQENKTLVALEKQPSKTLKDYADTAGFSFKYPEDIVVTKKETDDPLVYSNLELASYKEKGGISIKVEDTKLKTADDWLEQEKISQKDKKEIKIGEISGIQTQDENKLIAVSINQGVVFTIEVDLQNQKYWGDVYNAILSSFNFVSQASNVSETQAQDSSNDVTLEEETVE